jgi:hypothetical protein
MDVTLNSEERRLFTAIKEGVDTTNFRLNQGTLNVLMNLRTELLFQKASIDSLSYINNSDALLQAYIRHDINIQAYTYLIELSNTNHPTATSSEE